MTDLELCWLPYKVTIPFDDVIKPGVIANSKNSMDDILDKHVIIELWCKQNYEGTFSGYVTSWSFELESDAAHFKLVWA